MDIHEKLWIGLTVYAALWLLLVRTARGDPLLYWQIEYSFLPLVWLYAPGSFVLAAITAGNARPDMRLISEFFQVTGSVLVMLLVAVGFFRTVARMPPLDPRADRSALERDRPRIRLRR